MFELPIISLFVFVTIILMAVGVYYNRPQTKMQQRLEKMAAPEVGQSRDEELQAPFVQRVLAPMGNGVAKFVGDFTPAAVSQKTQQRLLTANLETRLTAAQFHGICWITGALGMGFVFFLLFATRLGRNEDDSMNIMMAVLYMVTGTAAGYILPQFMLSAHIKKRQEAILLAQPYALDLLSITVEAGLGFDAALGYAMRKMSGPLAEEFSKSLNEIRLGRQRLEALQDLGIRTGVEDMKIFMTAIVHASRLGSSITSTLRIQADSLRVRRRQQAQERAMKAPVKMTFPLVLLIFPALLMVVLIPGILKLSKGL